MADRSPYAARISRTPVRTEEISVRGSRTQLWVYGPRDAGRRVVFLHGLRGDHHGLEPIAAHLDGTQVLVPDLPAFGRSSPMPGTRHDAEGYAAWARELLNAVAPGGDAVLAGHSFGSIVAAAAVAGDGGSLASGLVLVNPIAAPALSGPHRFLTGLTAFYYRFAGVLPERVGTALLRHRVAAWVVSATMATTRDPAVRRFVHDQHNRHFATFATRATLLEAFGSSIRHDVSQYADQVRVPTLLVATEHDGISPLPTQRALALRFADARLSVVAGTGHLPHYETPAAVAREIDMFLHDRSRKPS